VQTRLKRLADGVARMPLPCVAAERMDMQHVRPDQRYADADRVAKGRIGIERAPVISTQKHARRIHDTHGTTAPRGNAGFLLTRRVVAKRRLGPATLDGWIRAPARRSAASRTDRGAERGTQWPISEGGPYGVRSAQELIGQAGPDSLLATKR